MNAQEERLTNKTDSLPTSSQAVPIEADNRRESYLDGLRGFAACVVFFGHLMISLFPSVVTLSPTTLHSRFDLRLGMSPFGFLWNGSSAVCIFFLLSGYVLTSLAQRSPLGLMAQMIRRYLRLALPMLLTSLLPLSLMAMGGMPNLAASEITHSQWLGSWYQFHPSLSGMVWEMLYRAFSTGRSIYNSNLWTMRIELLGSLSIFMITLLTANRHKRLLCYLLFAVLVPSDCYPLFAIGAVTYDYRAAIAAILTRRLIGLSLPAIMLMAGLYLCSMPAANDYSVLPWHKWIPVFMNDGLNSLIWHEIGACLVLFGALHTKVVRDFLSNRFSLWLGKISFTLYLIHLPLLCSFSSLLILLIPVHDYGLLAFLTSGVSLAVIFGLSTYLTAWVDTKPTQFSRRIGQIIDVADWSRVRLFPRMIRRGSGVR